MAILVQALVLIAIIGVGVGIKRIGWVRAQDFPIFSNIVLKITLPCALATSFDEARIHTSLLAIVAVGVVVNLAQQVAGHLIGRRHGRSEQAFAVLNIGTYNMGAFAVPYLGGFLGPQAIVIASLFDVGNAIVGAGIGYAWAMSLAHSEARVSARTFLRQIFSSVIFVTYLLLLALKLLDLRLPGPILQFTATVGAANTFLAMLMIGIGLEVHLHRDKVRSALRYLGVRYAFAIGFALTVWFLLPFEPAIRVVIVTVLFAPIASMTPGFTSEAGGDVERSAFMVSASILVGLVAMPALLLLLR